MPATGRRTTGTGRSERGMTLVEVLGAILLLSFVALGTASLTIYATRENKLAAERTIATSLAAERIERLMAVPYQGPANFANYALPYETVSAGPPKTFTADFGQIPGYDRYKSVVTLNYDVPAAGMLQVIVDVSWKNVHQGLKTHRMVVFLHPGLEQRQ